MKHTYEYYIEGIHALLSICPEIKACAYRVLQIG